MQQASVLSRAARARFVASRLPLLAGLLALAVPAHRPLAAQRIVDSPARRDPWAIDGQYLQLHARTLGRDATPSMGVTLGRDIGGERAWTWRGDVGFLRAVSTSTTAQGATIGMSASVAVPHTGRLDDGSGGRLRVRPGISLLAGWAESQDSAAFYAWRGVVSTPAAGTSGTQYSWSTTRGRTMGAGLSLGAELRVSPGLGVSASVRQWTFSGSSATSRQMTLVGVGVTARPLALARDARQLWRSVGSRTRAESGRKDDSHATASRSAVEDVR